MKILEKHVLKSFIVSFFFCILLLIVLGVIGDILGFLDDIFKNNIPVTSIILFYLHLAPFAFVNMVPFASLLSAVYVFNSLSRNHEVTAVIASGLSLWELLRPILFATFILCLATFIVNDKVVPKSIEKAGMIRQEELEGSGDDGKKKTKVDISVYGKGGQIIYAKSFDPEKKELYSVVIYLQKDDHSIFEKINARMVKWEDGAWVGKDVLVFKAEKNGQLSSRPEIYESKEIGIKETAEDFTNSQWDPRFMSYSQLKDYLQIFRLNSPYTVRRLSVDLNYKLAFPFTAIITVLIGVPFCIDTGRTNALIGMARGILVAVTYLPVMAVSLALGKGGILPPMLSAWLSNIIFVVFGIYYVNKKS